MFRQPLAREIAVIVAIKLVIVISAGLFVFGPKQRPDIDAASVRSLLLADPAETLSAPGPR